VRIPIGPYRLLAPIARGASAEVWAGVLHDRPVAIKIASGPDAASLASKKRMRAEFRAMARLDHRHIASVIDDGELDRSVASLDPRFTAGAPYLVLERISGGSLKTIATPVPWDRLCRWMAQLLDALGHAHARGVLHRDIKPANLLVSAPEDTRPGLKLADFGIARIDGQAHDDAPGTPAYAAPEQLRGQPHDQGPWSDLYAVGALCWRLATGAHVFGDLAGPALIAAKASAAPPRFAPPSGYPDLEPWLSRLLAPAPRDRFASAGEALDALSSYNPTLARAPAHPLTWCPPPTNPERVGPSTIRFRPTQLVGRHPEAERVWEAIATVCATRRATTLIVRGPAGIGKTRLIDQVLWYAEQHTGLRVLRIAPPTQGSVSGLIEAIYRLDGLSTAARRARVDAVALGEPAEAVFALAGGARASAHPKVWSERFQIAHRLLARYARSPIALCFDGTDEDTYPLIESLPTGSPLVTLVAARRDGRPRDAGTLDLLPLPADDIAAIVRSVANLDEATVASIEEEAQGNPGWAVARVADLARRGALVDGPGGLRATDARPPEDLVVPWRLPLEDVTAELAAELRDTDGRALLADPARSTQELWEALEVAAALGATVDDDDWEAAYLDVGRERFYDTDRVAALVARIALLERLRDRLTARRWIEPFGLGFRFATPSLRAAILDHATQTGRLPLAHRRCADVFQGRSRFDPLQLGRHLVRAGRLEEGAKLLIKAAVHTADAGELRAALAAVDLATQPDDENWCAIAALRADWLFRLGRVEASLGWAETSANAGQTQATRALAILRGATPPPVALAIAADCLVAAQSAEDPDQAMEWVSRGLAACEGTDAVAAIALRCEQVAILCRTRRYSEAAPVLEAVVHATYRWSSYAALVQSLRLELAAATDDRDAADAALARLRVVSVLPPPALDAARRAAALLDASRRQHVFRLIAEHAKNVSS
jgi:tRNA A-37 threonylcarbamoyl transferase component Bud32